MRKFGHIFSTLLFILILSDTVKAVTLDEFLDEVVKANPNIQAALLRAQAFAHKVKPTATFDDPFIAIGKDQIPFDGSMGSVTRYQISQTIPFPGKLGAKSDIAEDRAKSSLSDAETTKREIFILASQTYYRAYLNQQAIVFNEKIKNILENAVESTKARYKSGDSGHHEWLLAKIELDIIEVEKIKLQRERDALLSILNELRNKPSNSILGLLEVKFTNIDEQKNDSSILRDQSELKSLNFQLSLSEKEEKLARLTYFPDFVLQGMAMKPSSDMMNEKSNWGVMVGINFPLFFWRKQSELISAAGKDREAAIMEKTNLENRLNSEMIDAKLQLKTSRDVVSLYRDSIIPTTTLAVQNAKSGYISKRLPIGQFLETLKIQKTQELEYLAAQIDVEIAKTRLNNLLSSPPILRFAPNRPSLFSGGTMGSAMQTTGSDTVNMGQGMSGPSRKSKSSESTQTGSGMGNM